MDNAQPTIIKPFDLLESPLEGTNLIEASAGTGKTYAISGLFIRLILEKKLLVNEILVVTFTVAATEELKDRIRTLLKKAVDGFSQGHSGDEFLNSLIEKFSDPNQGLKVLREALRSFDEAAVFTIHGFCQRMLKENAFEGGLLFDTELITEQDTLEQEIADDFWRRYFYTAAPLFVNYSLNKKFTAEKLPGLVGNYSDKPHLKVIPQVDIPDTSRQETGFREAFEAARRAWRSANAEIKKILFDHEGLHRNIYRTSNISRWIEDLELFFSSGENNPVVFEKFEMFTARKINQGGKQNHQPPRHQFFDLCEVLKERQEALAQVYDQRLLGLKRALFDFLRQELEVRKQRKNVQSFHDLLIQLRKALEDTGGEQLAQAIRKKYRAALIDEFQDTDPVQYDIFHTIFKNQERILFLIGDPKQAIYSFRGADIFAYLQATSRVDAKYTLRENWRSDPRLIEAINTIFSQAENPFLFDEIKFEKASAAKSKGQEPLTIEGKAESPLQLWFLDAGTMDKNRLTNRGGVIKKSDARELILDAAGAEILRLLNLGKANKAFIGETPVKEQDIAVLVRTNQEAVHMQAVLSELRIPSVLYTMDNLFDTREAAELEQFLGGIVVPHNETLLRAALATDIIGVKGKTIEGLLQNDAEWLMWMNKFIEYQELWRNHNFIRMFRYILFKEKVRSRLLSFPDGERRLTNLLHLCEVLHQEATKKTLTMGGLLKWLSEQRNPDRPRREEHQLRLETDDYAVNVVTIHKSKGLEYPIVFCPFLWDGSRLSKQSKDNFTFHDGLELTLDLGSATKDANRALAEKEILAENLRLLYVALTRAKNRCYTVWGRINEAGSSAMAYLFNQAKEKAEEDLVAALESSFKKLTDNQVRESLQKVAEDATGAIHLRDMPQTGVLSYMPPSITKVNLHVRQFSGSIDRTWQVTSFSSLVAEKTRMTEHPVHPFVELPDYDREVVSERMVQEKPSGIFAFPRGAKAGSFMHDLFEHLDFTEKDNSLKAALVEDKLRHYGFELIWRETILAMTEKVLSAPLDSKQKNFTLSAISKKDTLRELEFYFPLQPLSPKKLKNIFFKYQNVPLPENFPERIESLQFSPAQGFMKGFIDLVFRFQGSYYLIDWKSNFLGITAEDYHQENLARVMEKEYYFLQYHLYSIALDKYLSHRIPDYLYEKHFGGVYYLFIRGIDPEKGSECGVFREKPPEELIKELSRSLIGSRREATGNRQ